MHGMKEGSERNKLNKLKDILFREVTEINKKYSRTLDITFAK